MSAQALLIGVTRFSDPQLSGLLAPRSDVEALEAVLADPSRGGFEVVTSIDEDLVTVRDKLSFLLDDRHPSDMVLLYYSGHGIVDWANNLFLCTGDTRAERPRARSLPATEIREMMQQSRAAKIIVVLDCCHSGVFTEGAKGRKNSAVNDATFDPGEGAEGHYVLTATNAIQYALDADPLRDEHTGGRTTLSHFTSWLVDGLGLGEAAPDKPYITLDDLYTYLCRRARQSGAAMTPQRYARNSGDMVIARNPAARPLTIPADLLAKFEDPVWSIRQNAVAELKDTVSKRPTLRIAARKLLRERIGSERDREVFDAMMAAFVELQVSAADLENVADGPEVQPNTHVMRRGIDTGEKASDQEKQGSPSIEKAPEALEASERQSIQEEIDARRVEKEFKAQQPKEPNRERGAIAVEREWISWATDQAEDDSQRKRPDLGVDTGKNGRSRNLLATETRESELDSQSDRPVPRWMLVCLYSVFIVGGATGTAFSKHQDLPALWLILTFVGSVMLVGTFLRGIFLGAMVSAMLFTGVSSSVFLFSRGSLEQDLLLSSLTISFGCAIVCLVAQKLWTWLNS
ncbi:hypothetical protein BTHE68_71970 (plasmid) [Burkholderia sp. THE68]|uniref:caspase family protein n=1 Tax=Burkholderia sp. THE68 TaxID=758782 RepID=UPI0013176B0D|nr:caspase family protein [Burkholderia sp. THE68]BBU33463.1 hypothetical protein BTHE68_71970 [Burkholderia sp. THE68]